MRGTLERVLRLRAIEEERARIELEAEAARLSLLEQAAERAAGEARGSRERWSALVPPLALRVGPPPVPAPKLSGGMTGELVLDPVSEGPGRSADGSGAPADGEDGTARRLEEALWGEARRERAEAEARRPGQQAEVERARATFLDGRRRRMEIESIVTAERVRAGIEAGRREQRQQDDWFQSRPRAQPSSEEDRGVPEPRPGGDPARF